MVAVPLASNPWFELSINCWIPLPTRETDLSTKAVTNYSNSPGQYDEPEGIFPDGQFTLVECDKQNLKGPSYVDLWRLKLDGSGAYERLTHFSDYPGYKASNPVVSYDGKFIAFQMATSREVAI